MNNNNLRVLIIDDSDSKMLDLIISVDSVLRNVIIDTAKSYHSGVDKIRDAFFNKEAYDFVLCDNVLPTYDDDFKKGEYANLIVKKCRGRYGNAKYIAVSSEIMSFCVADYFIKYDGSTVIPQLETIFKDCKIL